MILKMPSTLSKNTQYEQKTFVYRICQPFFQVRFFGGYGQGQKFQEDNANIMSPFHGTESEYNNVKSKIS